MPNAPEPQAAEPLAELLREAANGDAEALNRLLAVARPLLKAEVEKQGALHRQDASDVVQNCLLLAWQNAGAVQGTTEAQVRAWLKAIARNEFLDAVRHEHQQRRDVDRQVALPQDSSGGVVLADNASTPSQRATRNEEDERREQALRRLPADAQQVLRLRFHQGLAWDAVAQQMGRSESAVKQLYFRAVRLWKNELGDEP